RRQKGDAEDEPDADEPSVDLAVDTSGTDGTVDEGAESATEGDESAADPENSDGGQADDDEAAAATDSAPQTSAQDAADVGS
ncbi:hypothetical protein C6A85_89950, partial [Mycobacterium sp. ITM-2017-0098]